MNTAVKFLLLVAIILVVNLISNQFFFRLDLTEDKQYTLSTATKDILRNLDDPVTVTAYFTDGLPPQYQKIRNDFRDMLVEFNNISKGMVDFQFINPNEDPTLEQEVQQQGVRPILFNVRESDQVTQKRGYMAAIISLGELKDVIPLIQSGTGMEYSLATGIKKLSVVEKSTIGIVQGYGAKGMTELAEAVQSLSILYTVQPIELTSPEPIPPTTKAVAFLGPTDSIPAGAFVKLDAYLQAGGNLVVGVNAVGGDFQSAQGNATPTGVENWLASKGVQVEPNFVIDASSGSVTVQQRQGFFVMNTPVQFPYLPLLKNFAEHPISKGLEQVILTFASPVRYDDATGSGATWTPIAFTSDRSGIVRPPTFFDVGNKKWSSADFPESSIPVAGIVEGPMGGDLPAKLVVFGDADFPVSEQGRQANPDNVSLLVNSIDWLSDDTGLIELRTKGIASRPIEEVEEATRTTYKWANFLIPILLVIGYGFFRSQRNRSIRNRRMESDFV